MPKGMDVQRIFVTFLVCGVLVTALLATDSGITGFVSTETVSQDVNLRVDSSQRYELKTDGFVSSLSISGDVKGSGLVNVYLTDGANELLVYSNKRKLSSAMQHITGLSTMDIEPKGRIDRIDTLPGEYVTVSGAFESQCAQTCVLSEMQSPLYLDFVVDPGTSIHISKVIFSQ